MFIFICIGSVYYTMKVLFIELLKYTFLALNELDTTHLFFFL